MVVKILKVRDINTKDIPVADKINDVRICLCEECGRFYVYGDQTHNKSEIASYKFCKGCLSYEILNYGYNEEMEEKPKNE